MLPLDTRTPAVLLRIDRNPFHHGTLGAVRSLGRAGVEVHLVADDHESPVRHSRHLHRMHPPPAPGAPPAEVARVLRRVTRHLSEPAILIPMDDAGALAVSALHAELSDLYLLPRLAGNTAERVADKSTLARVCERAGVAHPLTVAPESAADAARAVRRVGLPAVAKWSRPWLLPHDAGLRSTTVIGSPEEAAALFERRGEAGSLLLLQAFVPGAGDADWFVHGCARPRRRRTRRRYGPQAPLLAPHRRAHGERRVDREPRTVVRGHPARLGPGLPRHLRPGLPQGRPYR
ncbi:hypothetical protein SALBM135S_06279 [Streptomyces alboniger]